jgi:hypothetical protein
MQSRPSSIKAAQNDRISTMFDRLCTLWCKGTTETAPHISLSKDLNMIRRFLTLALAPLSIVATSPAFASDFTVSSPDMANGLAAAAQFANAPAMGCTGGNVSPHVVWSGAPAGTKSLVVTMYDPDAPTGSGWWHWAVANIPAGTTELVGGAGTDASKLPAGAVQINTDAGRPGYGGPCPPVGQTHRYVITVTALKVDKLELPPFATPAMLSFMTLPHRLGQATFTAKGGR